MKFRMLLWSLVLFSFCATAQQTPKNFNEIIQQTESDLIKWRRHFHEFPELSNRETNTGKYIAEYLKSIGLEVRYPVAKTGVVAILKGGKPGPNVGLRADIDALPIVERTPVPFASKVKSTYNGQEVGVMHACGHDAHTAILMATATALKNMQKEVPGTIVFLFQPAEEGAPNGEEGGAPLMIKEGAMDNPKLDYVYGLHMAAEMPVGQISYKSGAHQASSDLFTITVKGRGNHGALPWGAIDPIAVSVQIYEGLQHIVSRQADLIKAPLVITVGAFNAGVRNNIIPETAEMRGTIRALDADMRLKAHESMRRVVKSIAESAGATGEVTIVNQTLVNYNDPELTKKSVPSLIKAVGADKVKESTWITAAEDFSFYGQKAPTFFFSLGALPPASAGIKTGGHHTPDFYLDESGFVSGVKAFCFLIFNPSKS